MDSAPNEVRALRYTEEMLASVTRVAGEPRVLLFAIRLPFDLPLPDGTHTALRKTSDDEESPWIELTVRKVVIEAAAAQIRPYDRGLQIVLGEAEADTSEGRVPQTWMMVGTLNTLFADEPADSTQDEAIFMTVAFERCLSAVNLLTQTTRLVTRELESRPLVKETLDPSIVWFRLDPPFSNLGPRRTLDLHRRPYNPVFSASDEVLRGELPHLWTALGLRLASEASPAPHPLVLPRALAIQAHGQRYRGDATSGVVTLQAASEGVLRGIHRMLLVDAGLSAADVVASTDVTFASLITSELPALLRGNWTGQRSPIMTYRSLLYSLRNETVHAGREPHWSQINPAFQAYEKLQEFLNERIRARWRSHPRTLAVWCEPWAGGVEDGLSAPARETLAQLRLEPVPYWLPNDVARRLG